MEKSVMLLAGIGLSGSTRSIYGKVQFYCHSMCVIHIEVICFPKLLIHINLYME